jgi:hypothetical protein
MIQFICLPARRFFQVVLLLTAPFLLLNAEQRSIKLIDYYEFEGKLKFNENAFEYKLKVDTEGPGYKLLVKDGVIKKGQKAVLIFDRFIVETWGEEAFESFINQKVKSKVTGKINFFKKGDDSYLIYFKVGDIESIDLVG